MTIKDIPEIVLKGITDGLEGGMLEEDVAIKYCSSTTYWRWKKEILKVNESGNVVDIDGNVLTKNEKGEWDGQPIYEFKELVDKAIIAYKEKIYKALTINSVKSGKIALEVLRRRFPSQWNVPQKIEHEGAIDIGMKDVADALTKIYNEDDDTNIPEENKSDTDTGSEPVQDDEG